MQLSPDFKEGLSFHVGYLLYGQDENNYFGVQVTLYCQVTDCMLSGLTPTTMPSGTTILMELENLSRAASMSSSSSVINGRQYD